MQISQKLKLLLRDWEGMKQSVYNDSSGKPTIGIGHLLTQSELSSGKIIINGEPVDYRKWLTGDQVWNLLSQDMQAAEDAVNQLVTVPLNQNQFDALVSFTFNMGSGAFHGSTLLKLLNLGHYELVVGQLSRWVHDHFGHVVPGLVNRRNKEIALWNEVENV